MRTVGLALCGLLVAAASAGAGSGEGATRATFTDPAYGFSLEVPALGEASAAVPVVQRVVVSGPAVDGFATNCNVQVQLPGMSHADFVELSVRQFAGAGLELRDRRNERVSGREATRFEYRGPLGGRELHFLALAVTDGERLLLLTCTTLAARWERERAALEEVVASFRLPPPG